MKTLKHYVKYLIIPYNIAFLLLEILYWRKGDITHHGFSYSKENFIKIRKSSWTKEITVGGWIRSLRDSKAFGFIVISDGTYFETLQAVYHDTLENFAQVSKLGVGTAIIVKRYF